MKKIVISGLLLLGFAASAQVKVGTNPTSINTSAELEVESTNKGFLPPRMTTAQRNAIANPVAGLMIYNTTTNCINYFEGTRWVENCVATASSGTDFTQPPAEPYGSIQPEAFSGVSRCAEKTISVTPCSKVPGAVLNDDPSTPLGKEYNWSGNANSQWMQSGATRALVEINGQCWYRRNADNAPTNGESFKHPQSSAQNSWGRMYTPAGFANGIDNLVERTQGICAPGFHVPSDCEYTFLEYSLGMSKADLESVILTSIGVAQGIANKLTLNGVLPESNNASGFAALKAGTGFPSNVGFTFANLYTSSTAVGIEYIFRAMTDSGEGGLRRSSSSNNYMPVRCLKD